MARGRWTRIEEDGAVVITRRLPPRFDLQAEVCIPVQRAVSRGALAHQVRQDLWRALQDLPGFAPVVRVAQDAGGLRVTAGGRLEGGRAAPRAVVEKVQALLEDRARQSRWLAHAGRLRHG